MKNKPERIRISKFETDDCFHGNESFPLDKFLSIIKEKYPHDIPASAKESDILIQNFSIYFEYYPLETDQEYYDRTVIEREKDLKEIKRLAKKLNLVISS